MSTSGRWSSPDSIFHSLLLIPSEKLFGSNEGIEGIARMSPLVDIDDHDCRRLVADPSRRIFVQVGVDGQLDCVAAAVRLGIELLDQLAPRGDFHPLPAGLTAKVDSSVFSRPSLPIFTPGIEQQRVLVFLSYSSAEAAPT